MGVTDYIAYKVAKRKMEMLFVRGDGVILVSFLMLVIMRTIRMSNLMQYLVVRSPRLREHEFVQADQAVVFLMLGIHCQYIFRQKLGRRSRPAHEPSYQLPFQMPLSLQGILKESFLHV
jgi:hypothetical protein